MRSAVVKYRRVFHASYNECEYSAGDGIEGREHVRGGVHFVGGSPDLSHAILESEVPLTSTSASKGGLYEWSGGSLQLVSVLPEGPEGGGAARAPSLGYGKNARNAVSTDGSRVVWSALSQEDLSMTHLYMRSMPGGQAGETVRLDTAQLGGMEFTQGEGARFQTASSDDSRVFFTDTNPLTADSYGVEANSNPDLYVCEMVEVAGKLKCELTDITPEGVGGEAADVLKVVPGASGDGSYVYFVAKGVLASGTSVGSPMAGSPNLYAAHLLGGKWTTTFIATLGSEDAPDWGALR